VKKIFLFVLMIILNEYCLAFEIKPVGFNSEKWINDHRPEYTDDTQDESCDGKFTGIWYKTFNANPVHEIITADAAKKYCNSYKYNESIHKENGKIRENIFSLECDYILGKKNRSSSNSPIISGSFFNDDPTGRIRDEGYGLLAILRGAIEFGSMINDKENTSTTYESHNGRNQFLHAMKSAHDNGLPKEEPNDTRKRIVEYIAENFNLARYINEQLYSEEQEASIARLNALLNTSISRDGKYGFILDYKSDKDLENGCKYDKYINLFYCGESFKWGEFGDEAELKEETVKKPFEDIRTHARTLALLALGSAMHVIQDSYSTSHAQRDEKTNKIKVFYQYDNGNKPPLEDQSKHCQHDAYVRANNSSIDNAFQQSKAFLELVTINKNHFNNHSDQHCREAITNWLNKNVFQLANEGSTSLSSVTARPDACVADAP